MYKKLFIFISFLFLLNALSVSSFAETKVKDKKETKEEAEDVMDMPLEDLLNVEITSAGKKATSVRKAPAIRKAPTVKRKMIMNSNMKRNKSDRGR